MNDDNVIRFQPIGSTQPTKAAKGLTAGDVLKGAMEVEFDQCMVVGWTTEGPLYLAATTGYNPDNIALLEVAKQELVNFYLSDE